MSRTRRSVGKTSGRPRRRLADAEAEAGITVRAISVKAKRADISRQITDADAYFEGGSLDSEKILATPFNMQNLSVIFEGSNILRQCISAMVTNVASNGYRVVPTHPDVPMNAEERKVLQSFINSSNPEESLTTVHEKTVRQYEKWGFGYYEVVRNRKGVPSLLKSTKSIKIRIIKPDKNDDPVEVVTTVVRGGRRSRVRELKYFNKYVQRIGSKVSYFKEFGDPRRMSYKTGRYESDGYTVRDKDLATELLHRRQDSEDSYGLPRWISQIPNILGSREAEEVNLRYFEDNTVPPMMLSVGGGRLTRQSFLELQSLLQEQGIGRDRQNKIILIEAVPEVTDIDGKGSVSVKVDKLTDARQSDGLFKDYDEANMAKIRSAFRLPPVLLGQSQDVNFATANVSAYLADVQVFGPERRGHDEFLNKKFVNHPAGLNLRTVKLESLGPAVTNSEQIVKTMTALNTMGGMTPRKAITLVNELLQIGMEQYPLPGEDGYDEWMDMPISLAQRAMISGSPKLGDGNNTQQTGQGEDDRYLEQTKDGAVSGTEDTGAIEPTAVEHGQE